MYYRTQRSLNFVTLLKIKTIGKILAAAMFALVTFAGCSNYGVNQPIFEHNAVSRESISAENTQSPTSNEFLTKTEYDGLPLNGLPHNGLPLNGLPLIGDAQFVLETALFWDDPHNCPIGRNGIARIHEYEGGRRLVLSRWRIESFKFLTEIGDITELHISESYITQGAFIPHSEPLNSLREIYLLQNYVSGVADILSEAHRFSALRTLKLSGEIVSETALPHIPSLTNLYVYVPDALEIIANNGHIEGILSFALGNGRGFLAEPRSDITSLAGIEIFENIEMLIPPSSVQDISLVANNRALRFIDLSSNERIYSLMPLYELEHLLEVWISGEAYFALAENEREHFNPLNNRYSEKVHVYIVCLSEIETIGEGELIFLYDKTIDCFEFLKNYPNLRYLFIFNCNIAGNLVLPRIDTLEHLSVIDQNAMNLIRNNYQLFGYLEIGSMWSRAEEDSSNITPIKDFTELEVFASLRHLAIRDPIYDLTPLSRLDNLHILSIMFTDELNSLEPLSRLPRLRLLHINHAAFRSLPANEIDYWINTRSQHVTRLTFAHD